MHAATAVLVYTYSKDGLRRSSVLACICRGVKFHGIDTRHLQYGTELQFKREPTNPYDSNAVLVFVVGSGPRLTPLGHVAAGPAKWLSRLLLGPYTVSG